LQYVKIRSTDVVQHHRGMTLALSDNHSWQRQQQVNQLLCS